MRVYFTFDPRPDLKESLVNDFPEVDFIFHKTIDDKELAKAEVLVTYGEDLDEEKINIAKKVKWIFVASSGIEKMPHQAIAERGIVVSNVRGIHKKPMAESILAHLLSIKRALPFIYKNQQEKTWNQKTKLYELNGSTALILGPGAIGSEVGRMLQAFDVYTIGVNRSGESAPYMNETHSMDKLKELLPKADILISILPSTVETRYLLNYEHFTLLKDHCIFMNFGRGDLVKTEDLIRALEEKQIFHAVLDVFETEPLPGDSKLWEMENVTISPHISSRSSRYLERSFEIFKRSLRKWMNGERNLENKMDILKGY
ncbi:D-2-hydroxyacid dehydrogenase [Ureibacillus thermophilus]|uniref:D-2-hydroxyacid dehydrogenase n=1 Tax=Ureibacillus thermophilus TaxID=367743 RepID=A0A4P6UYF2_9BACL|nr:D-2-hydroxyacid dehydrogenase [Ureibacillus thermophilus]QBK26952.1 D-2-hydroxyacid dehydrogenase [Ureibacillus thermophilus]